MIKQHTTLNSSKRIINHLDWVRTSYPTAFIEKKPTRSLSNNLLLAAQSEAVLDEILPFIETVNLSSGDYLYQPGDPVDFIYFPETAIVSEFQILEDGRTVEIAMIGNDGVLGILPLFNSGGAVNWTQVSVGGTLSKIKSDVLEKKIACFPELRKYMFGHITDYVRQISQRSVCNSYHVIEQRLCTWLLMIQDRKRSNKIPLTQEQIARSLGVHRPSLTHIAQNLRAKKIIDYVRGKIYILNRAELENSACACFSELRRQFEIH